MDSRNSKKRSVLQMRTDNSQDVETDVRYASDLKRTPNSKKSKLLKPDNKKVGTNVDTSSPLNLTGKPLETPPSRVLSAKGTLFKDGAMGDVRTYSSRKPLKMKDLNTPAAADEEVLDRTVEATTLQKTQSAFVTSASLSAAGKENRAESQNAVMSTKKSALVSASIYAQAVQEPQIYQIDATATVKQRKFEWLHLIAHSIAGNKKQIPENLVAQTAQLNTWMIPGELLIKHICNRFPDGITITVSTTVKAIEIAGAKKATHFAVGKIKYHAESTTGFKYDFSVDAKYNEVTPHIDYGAYLEIHLRDAINDWVTEQAKIKLKK